tara:strand:- start:5716 stop:6513 length:798 start_codon:yes stop_codon:yes gene_type:complete
MKYYFYILEQILFAVNCVIHFNKIANRNIIELFFNFILALFSNSIIKMNRLPEIDLEEDLAIISTAELQTPTSEPVANNEDLKADPFVRAPPLTSFAPQPPAVGKKEKKAASEKQKAHLANARKLAKERKAELKQQQQQAMANDKVAKKEAEKVTTTEIYAKEPEPEPEPEPEQFNPMEQNFDAFLQNMDKYNTILRRQEQQAAIKRAEAELREAELEQKYFKKFEALKLQTKAPANNTHKEVLATAPEILNKPQNDYGLYSSYF